MGELPKLEPVTVQPIEPESVDFYQNSTLEEWIARMAEKYGPDFEARESFS